MLTANAPKGLPDGALRYPAGMLKANAVTHPTCFLKIK